MNTLSCIIVLLLVFALPFLMAGAVYLPSLITVLKQRRFLAVLHAIGDRIVDRLVNIEPLPGWTNKYLAIWMGALWAFAISLNWYADSKIFVISCISILGFWILGIFIAIERPSFYVNQKS